VKYVQAIGFTLPSDNPSALFQIILRLLTRTVLGYDILGRAITCAQKAAKKMQPSPPSGTAAPSDTPAGLAGERAEPIKRSAPIAGDILHGADEIAEFLFGDRKHRRRVYNLVDGNRLPIFRIGANICARRSILLEWISAQEKTNAKR
jgi:hypothetical protein